MMLRRTGSGKEHAGKILQTSRLVRAFAAVLCVLVTAGLMPVRAEAASQRVVRVGYYSEDDSYMKGGSDSTPKSGYAYDYLQKISDYTEWKYKYVYGDWLSLMSALEEGKIDLLFDVSYTSERAEKMLFPKNPAGKETNYLFAREDDQRIDPANFSTLNGKKVGIYGKGVQYTQFLDWEKKNGVTCKLVLYEHSSDRNADLENGKLDALVATDAHTEKTWRPIDTIGSTNYYFAVAKGREDILRELNAAQTQILAASPYYNEELQRKYFSYNVLQQNLTDEEQKWVAEHRTIRVGYLRNYAPYCQTGSNGISGVASVVFRKLRSEHGLRFSARGYDTDSALNRAFQAGKIDVMVPVSDSNWYAEKNGYLITASIASAEMSVVSKNAGVKHLYDRVAVTTDLPLQLPYVKVNYPDAKIVKCAGARECLKAVLSGRATCTVFDSAYLQLHLKNAPELRKLNLSKPYYEDSVALAVHEGDSTLLSVLNKGIAAVGEDQLENSYIQNSLNADKVTFLDMVKSDQLATGLLVLIFAILLAFILLLVQNRKRLIAARRSADRANEAKGQFLSRMSHEIRTPMNAIVGLTAIALAHEQEPQKLNGYLTKIDSSSKVLLSLINDVLDMSAIESGKLRIANVEFDLRTVLDGISSVYYAQCEQKGIHFSMAVNLQSERYVGDSLRINQILLNLISNACKFTDTGGAVRILVNQTARDGETATLRFEVSDTGCGMSEEMLARLFNPFEQASADTARQHGGSGLGLSITKNLVELMKGSIRVESKAGVGSKFTVEIPLRVAPQPEAAGRQPVETLRALVADDEQPAREYTGLILERLGLPYDLAESGQQALALVQQAKQSGKPYDICFLDWKMPSMDGVETTRQIRATAGADTLLIILSAYNVAEVENEARKAGANLFLTKPLFQSTVYNLLLSLSGGALAGPEGTNSEHYDFTGRRVLVAEDNEINREVAEGLLECVHMQADFAVNGERAVKLFASYPPGTYDAILMDVQMPVMDGYEAARSIRRMERPDAKTIPIYAMTADAFAEDVHKALDSGMNGHIAKPIDQHELYRRLREAVLRKK
jgi:signal transduction histidine kinase/CheY-like chemotaxis protein